MRSLNAPLHIQNRVLIHDSVIQNNKHMWIHSSENHFSVVTKEDIDARVIDLGKIESSENWTWMGNRIGNVVHKWRSENQTALLLVHVVIEEEGLLAQQPRRKRT